MSRTSRCGVRIAIALAVVLIGSLPGFASAGTGFGLRIPDEVAPPGGVALIQVQLTEPAPISGGHVRLALDTTTAAAVALPAGAILPAGISRTAAAAPASPFGAVLAIALLSSTGDVQGSVTTGAGAVSIQFSSPNSTFGTELDLPIMIIAVAVNPDAPVGMTVPINLDISNSQFLDSSGNPYPMEVKQGIMTVGGVSISRLVSPGSPAPAGSTLTLRGVGFQQGAKISVNNVVVASTQVVSAGQIDFTAASSFAVRNVRIRLTNPDKSSDEFYAIDALTDLPLRFAPGSLTMIRGTSADLNLGFAIPASGASLAVSSSNPGIVAAPASLAVRAGDSTVALRIFAQAPGDTILTATQGSLSATIPVHVLNGTVIQVPVIRNDAVALLGLALTNRTQSPADVTLRGFTTDPANPGAQPAVTVTASMTIPSQGQVVRFLNQYDPKFAGFSGWIEISSSNSGVNAMFLNMPETKLAFAGSSDSNGASTSFILPQSRLDPSGDFDFVLINNNPAQATVTLEWQSASSAAIDKTVAIGLQGALISSVLKSFPELAGGSVDGYLTIRSSVPLVAYQQHSGGPLLLGGAPPAAAGAAQQLLVPHVVAAAGWLTELALVNPSASDVPALLSLRDDAGNLVSGGSAPNPASVVIPAHGQLIAGAQDLFGISELGGLVVGSLQIQAQGNIVGSAVVGDSTGTRFGSSVPVLSNLFSEAIFAQVATGNLGGIGYFTGLGFQNPGISAATIQIEVFTDQGTLNGQTSVSIPAGGRLSKLLSELIPGLAPQIGGHVHVTASAPVGMIEIFGDDQLDFITTVAASIIR